jgi:hypothetical protein
MKIAITCPQCEGGKQLPCRSCGGIGGEYFVCWDCGGKATKPCNECDGEGEILAEMEELCLEHQSLLSLPDSTLSSSPLGVCLARS